MPEITNIKYSQLNKTQRTIFERRKKQETLTSLLIWAKPKLDILLVAIAAAALIVSVYTIGYHAGQGDMMASWMMRR